MTGAAALAQALPVLRAAGIDDAAGDARRLLAHVLGIAPGLVSTRLAEALSTAQQAAYVQAVSQRAARQPVAQIIGRRAFYNGVFRVTPDVLDPRPETETLVRLALQAPFARLLDLGTGSGNIAISLLMENPGARALATDISPAALQVATGNAAANGVADRFETRRSHWFDAVTGRFDLIVANPPYIAAAEMAALAAEVREHEPRMALTDEGDGLGAFRIITAGAGAHLAGGGRLMVEIGATQAAAVARLFDAAGLKNTRVFPDLSGHDRVIGGEMPKNPA